jgi:hypothetical protein
LAELVFVDGLIAATHDEALYSVEQFEPVFQRRFGDVLPLVEALFAVKKFPFAANVLRVDLQLDAFVSDSFPTDFCFGHGASIIHAGNSHGGDTFLPANEAHVLVRGGFDADLMNVD